MKLSNLLKSKSSRRSFSVSEQQVRNYANTMAEARAQLKAKDEEIMQLKHDLYLAEALSENRGKSLRERNEEISRMKLTIISKQGKIDELRSYGVLPRLDLEA